jgi:serine protease Do
MKGGPAEEAGLRAGDVITQLGGAKITEVPDLQRRVAAVAPGEAVALTVIRDRKPLSVTIKVGEMPAEEVVATAEAGEEGWGLAVAPIPPELAERLGPDARRGVVVVEVAPEGAADKAGLRRGDLIFEVNQESVVDPASLRRILAGVKPGASVRLYVQRVGGTGAKEYLVLERPAR